MSSHHRSWRRLGLLILSVLLGTVLLLTTHAQPTNAHHPNNPRTFATYAPQISPDGQFVVYRGVNPDNNIATLYSAPITGGTPIELGGLAYNLDSFTFAISPDSTTVVYISRNRLSTGDLVSLYSVPITGGPAARLSGRIREDHIPVWVGISPDSTTVVYMALNADYLMELYSVPINGGTPTRLNPPLDAGERLWEEQYITISPDSTTVLYTSSHEDREMFNLYAVPIRGGTSTKLSTHPLVENSQAIEHYYVTPDSTRVLYQARNSEEGHNQLYVVPITGGTPSILDTNLDYYSARLSPDGSNAVYTKNGRPYRIPLTGGTPFKLDPYMSGSYAAHPDFIMSPDSSRVVYTLRHRDSYDFELRSAPISINGPSIRFGSGFPTAITPDSSTLLYFENRELYSVSITGGTPTKLSTPIPENTSVKWTAMSPDGSTFVYLTKRYIEGSNSVPGVYAVPINGGRTFKLDFYLSPGRFDYNLAISPDGSTVVYSRSPSLGFGFDTEVYAVPITGGIPMRLD